MTQASPSDPSLSTGLANRTGPTGDLVPGEDRAGFASLPLSLAVQQEMVCGRFEDAWRATGQGGNEPRPEDYLASAPEIERRRRYTMQMGPNALTQRRGLIYLAAEKFEFRFIRKPLRSLTWPLAGLPGGSAPLAH
jgi:hypothetical protein